MFGGQLHMLPILAVFHAQLVVALGANFVAAGPEVLVGDQVAVGAVMHRVGDIGPVGVAVVEGDGDFGAVDEREVKAGLTRPGEGLGQAHPATALGREVSIAVEVELDPVVAVLIDVGIGIAVRRGNAGADGAGDPGPVGLVERQAVEAVRGNRGVAVVISNVARACVGDAGDQLALHGFTDILGFLVSTRGCAYLGLVALLAR